MPTRSAVTAAARDADLNDDVERWSQAAFSSDENAFALLDLDGCFVIVNAGFEQVTGLDSRSLRGRAFSDFWQADLFGSEIRLIERLQSDGAFTLEAQPVPGEHAPPPVALRVLLTIDGMSNEPRIGVQLLTSDNAERKRELSSDPAGFDLSFDQIAVGMMISGLEGHVIRVNNAFCALVGRTRPEIATIDIMSMVVAEDRAGDIERGLQAYAGEIDGWTREKRMQRCDGSTVWVLETATLVRDELGQPLHFLSQFVDIAEQRRVEDERNAALDALRRSEAQVKFLADGIPVALAQVDKDSFIRAGNAGLQELVGRDPIGLSMLEVMHPEDLPVVTEAFRVAAQSAEEWRVEFRVVRPDGSTRWVRSHTRTHHDDAGRFAAATSTWTDITDEVDARRASERFIELLEAVDDVIAVADASGALLHLNRSGHLVLPAHVAHAEGSGLVDLFSPESADLINNVAFPAVQRDNFWTGEVVMEPPGQPRRVVSLSLVAHRDQSGRVECVSAISRDISELKEAEAQLRHQATTDALTGLPNRSILYDRLGNALARSGRQRGEVAVLFVDLDRFKPVNDRWGHEAGDELLVQVGERLSMAIREGDTVARIGGDEFVVLAEPIMNVGDAKVIGDRIVNALGRPFALASSTVTISASVGLAMADRAMTATEVVNVADRAVYQAKAQGRSRVVVAC